MKVIPCDVSWCDRPTHPDERVIAHTATVVDLAPRSPVRIVLAWAENRERPMSVLPHVRVIHDTDDAAEVDLTDRQAIAIAWILAGLDPADEVRFAVALATAGGDIASDSGREYDGVPHRVVDNPELGGAL